MLLRLVNRPLESANALLRWLYTNGLLVRRRSPIPVISVGNITMGGTGKTPLVEALARTLLAVGAHPAIVTRGYRRQGKSPIVLRGDPGQGWYLAGDEPSLLARNLPQVPVVVDANRHRGCLTAAAQGATHVLLDDGFQHFQLQRELDLVVTSAADPLGRSSPRREGPRALRFASRVVSVGEPRLQEKAAEVLRRFHSLPPFQAWVSPKDWYWQGQRLALATLFKARVVAFAGIAHPARFFSLLVSLGANLVKTFTFSDHHPYSKEELQKLLFAAEKLGAIPVTTAKDHIRLPQELAGPVAYLEVCLQPLTESFLDIFRDLPMAFGRIAP